MLLALFIMGAMLVVGLGISSLAINQIRQNREIKKITMAYYTAEAGIEEAVFHWRQSTEAVKNVEDLWGYEVLPFYNNATTSLSFVDYEWEVVDSLKKNEIVSLDLYNMDDLSSSSNIRSIRLEWDGKPTSWLEVTWKSLTASPYYSDNAIIQKRYVPYQDGISSLINLTAGPGQADYIRHSVQIKALYDEVKNLTVKAYSDTSGLNQVNIPSRVYISSLGEYPMGENSRARYNLTVSMPEKTPLSPMFDYVIFSEEDFTKTIIYTGSSRPQLVYDECGPYVWYPDCEHVFGSATEIITVRNIGVQTATLSVDPVISDPSKFSIQLIGTDDCSTANPLSYNDVCYIKVRVNNYGQADLTITTSSPLNMLLNASRP